MKSFLKGLKLIRGKNLNKNYKKKEKKIKMKLSEWIKIQKRDLKEIIPREISHDSTVFERGHNYAFDKLLEVLEEQEIDFEIPNSRGKY